MGQVGLDADDEVVVFDGFVFAITVTFGEVNAVGGAVG